MAHPLFIDQIDKLIDAIQREKSRDSYRHNESGNAKLLTTIDRLVFDIIPQDPARAEYRQGNTLGEEHRHWFRAKFGGRRFRLFFRYSSQARIIIFAWVNDQSTLRTYGSKSDAYTISQKMLKAGNPPNDWDTLLTHSTPIPPTSRPSSRT